ncbi:MAG TPA: aminodeoxychorismate synthase component I [Rhodocyclaceae bacterium]|nr:aminodeoxychorismate synthase component I [Rhodocyclaceae bacterium]
MDRGSLAAALAEVERGDAWWVVALDYELGYALEPAAAPGWRPDGVRPLARFWAFRSCRRMDAADVEYWLQARLDALLADAARAGIGGLGAGLDASAYEPAVERIRAYIDAGDCYQVNYTFPLHFQWFGHPLALYGALRRRQPVRYGGVVVAEEGGVISLSPELFLERRGDRLVTRPMKGTAPRSVDPESLRASEKDRAENLMIVDLLRNDLGRVAAGGSVRVDSLFEIEDYPTLWQMVSQVSAQVPERSFGDILEALFPCGSITGAPKIRAMQIISELEGQPRGLYTGALGWLAPGGDFRLNVAIRTLELAADGSGRLGIGSGIVADSDPGSEWRECLLKSAFLTELDPGLLLIETLRREDGRYPRLAGHLARLRSSAAWLGFPFDEAAVRAALAASPESGLWRVRFTLSKAGDIDVTASALGAEPTGPRLAGLARDPIDSRNPLRRHKTTARAAYDAALQGIAGKPEVFDMVFLNERGEVAEGARSNVFVERDGILLTPPLESGALPGVLRAELLAAGRAREAVLRPVDLADGFLLGNALRGLVPVRLPAA